jgi:hypothetical protein
MAYSGGDTFDNALNIDDLPASRGASDDSGRFIDSFPPSMDGARDYFNSNDIRNFPRFLDTQNVPSIIHLSHHINLTWFIISAVPAGPEAGSRAKPSRNRPSQARP